MFISLHVGRRDAQRLRRLAHGMPGKDDLSCTIKATVKEAVANAEISKEKEVAETRPRVARSGTGEIRRSQHAHVEKRTADLRSRHH